MKRIVIVRHGNYDKDYHLDEKGRQQMTSLGEKLKATISGDRIVILSSSADRARESAEVLREIFGGELEEHDVLGIGGLSKKLPKILELVRSKKNDADVLILVTHLDMVEVLPNYFGQNELDVTTFYHMGGIPKGEAWDISCEEKTIAHIC